ncbi:MAG: DUF937 domain-containing protein [Rikenellaceae bacterium]|jgi:hypothetical protein|nr:DUF937 domain-containing protein [Rikenellaceae bacterium]
MEQMFDSLKTLIDSELPKAAAAVGEPESKVSRAVPAILSGILAKLTNKGATASVESALREGEKTPILTQLDTIFGGKASREQEAVGNKLIQAIMGGKAGEFTAAISNYSGVSQSSSNKLTAMVSTVVAGFLGNQLSTGNTKAFNLLGDLRKEKSHFAAKIPSGVQSALGLSNQYIFDSNTKQNKKGGLLVWLTLSVALVLLLVFGINS